jgi:hypothetical protein
MRVLFLRPVKKKFEASPGKYFERSHLQKNQSKWFAVWLKQKSKCKTPSSNPSPTKNKKIIIPTAYGLRV